MLNEKNTVFCELDDVEKWKVEIEKLLADDKRRVELGKLAKEVVGDYTWLTRAEKIMRGM